MKIALKEDSKTLDEVVVVGYATVKKANLTGAVSAVDDKVLADRPIVNLGQGLQGTIPNLNITTQLDSREKAQASMSAVKRPSTVVARWFWLTEYRWTRT